MDQLNEEEAAVIKRRIAEREADGWVIREAVPPAGNPRHGSVDEVVRVDAG